MQRMWSANFFGHLQMLTVFSLAVLQWCSKQEVFRTPSSAAYSRSIEILDVAGYLLAHAVRPWTEELTGKG